MATALALASRLASAAAPARSASEVSTTLPIGASVAYEVFCDTDEIPRWLPILQSARVMSRDREGRAARVAFMRQLERGSLGYTLAYHYDSSALTVDWTTLSSSNVRLTGEAQFVPLTPRACMMLYRIDLDLPIVNELLDGELDRHRASLVVAEFREHVRRLC
jgi:ribosome-associated toxin RatA of RatAB toxin-antitoxin module